MKIANDLIQRSVLRLARLILRTSEASVSKERRAAQDKGVSKDAVICERCS
jgi:hypothetical protein